MNVECSTVFNNDACYLKSEENELRKIKFKDDVKVYFVSPDHYVEVNDAK